jgi:hypothetical protein
MGLLLFIADWYFYRIFAAVEVALTASIFWIALKWPRTAREEEA